MKKFILLILLLISTTAVFSQKDKNKIEAAIVGFFNGLSLRNADTIKYYSTSDFHLLETGEVWNMDTLLSKISGSKNPNVIRINKFEFIKTVQNGGIAWVSYFNTAEFRLGEKKQIVRWLESVVVIKEDNRWKIQMMHSTDLK